MIDYSRFNIEEEIRDNFLVDTKRKKIWSVELQILESFDLFCKEKGLTYFVDYGTLLGAVRHKGFIPWDDDLDITMPRPEYTRFVNESDQYFKQCYPHLWIENYYTDDVGQMAMLFSRIRDDRTTMIEEGRSITPKTHLGIWIDVMPLDIAPATMDAPVPELIKLAIELWQTVTAPKELLSNIIMGQVPTIGLDETLNILGLPYRERFILFENVMNQNYSAFNTINFFSEIFHTPSMKKEWYSDTILLPFENTKVQAPIGYHEILTAHYGDYMKQVKFASDHGLEMVDPDNSYSSYISNA